MIWRCVVLVLLDLSTHTFANPGGFYHDLYSNRGSHVSNPQHYWGDLDQQDWWHTTQRVRTRQTDYKSSAQTAKISSPSTSEPTSPRAVIIEDEKNDEDNSAATNFAAVIESNFNAAKAGEVGTALASDVEVPAVYEIDPSAGRITTVTTGDVSAGHSGDITPVTTGASGHVSFATASDINAEAGDLNAAISDVGATTESQIALTTAGEVSEPQWHVGIYRTTETPYTQICAGSLIKRDVVLSAGHCFWTLETEQLPSDQFAAAAGKRYRAWDDPRDRNAQYSEIKDIVISRMLQPCFSPDLAVLTLATSFSYGVAVKPICLDFDPEMEKLQLRKGNVGLIAGWGVVSQGCALSQRLRWSTLPFVPLMECITGLLLTDVDWVDRICAGDAENKDKVFCETDSGSGLAFLDKSTPYLQGVATFASENKLCFTFNTTSFTKLRIARKFLSKNIPSSQECQDLYRNSSQIELKPNGANQKLNVTSAQLEQDQSFLNETFTEYPNEDEPIFSIASIGSIPVPPIGDTSAPSYQWHVGVYSKVWAPYMQICGGSLVKRDVIISAAHCFWDDSTGQQPATQYGVAGGKLYRPWNDTHDTYAQWSDVSQITLPVRFRGTTASFQDDIAVVRLSSPFTYALGVQPACVDFDLQFDRQQLASGNLGTVTGWGLTKVNGGPSQRLNYLKLPYVDIDKCISSSSSNFLKYITSDKICAGDQLTGKALCRGDSGGGLVFFSNTSPYLRGVASTAEGNNNLCNAFAIATFTQLHTHRTFLRDNIPDVDKECKQDSATGNVGVDAATGEQDSATGIDKGVETTTRNGLDRSKVEYGTGDDGKRVDTVKRVETTLGRDTSRVDLTTGNDDKRVDVATGSIGADEETTTIKPFISNYQPPMQDRSQLVPFNHFYCNCNCKS